SRLPVGHDRQLQFSSFRTALTFYLMPRQLLSLRARPDHCPALVLTRPRQLTNLLQLHDLLAPVLSSLPLSNPDCTDRMPLARLDPPVLAAPVRKCWSC